jgi:hypothetical protein
LTKSKRQKKSKVRQPSQIKLGRGRKSGEKIGPKRNPGYEPKQPINIVRDFYLGRDPPRSAASSSKVTSKSLCSASKRKENKFHQAGQELGDFHIIKNTLREVNQSPEMMIRQLRQVGQWARVVGLDQRDRSVMMAKSYRTPPY